jgi:glutamyl-tRNA synthetase
MINFLVLLGWSPKDSQQKDEIYALKDLINEFDLAEVGKSPAIFDTTKLDYFNGYYIRQMELGELAKRCLPYLEKAGLTKNDNDMVLKAVALIQERMKKLSEVVELTEFFFKEPTYEKELLVTKGASQEITLKALEESYRVLDEETDFSHDSLEQLLRALATKMEIPAGYVLWPIRAALTGKPTSPGTFELLGVFSREVSLARIKKAIDILK